MKKIMFWATAVLLALASCQKNPGYRINGMIVGVPDGEKVYMQDLQNGNMEVLDSAVVEGGKFKFMGVPDSVTVSRYITYSKDDMNMIAMVFIEKGEIVVDINPEGNKVGGTQCNDAYQRFMDRFMAMNKEMMEMYNKLVTDTTMTPEQRRALEDELNEKDVNSTEEVFKMVSANIKNLVGVQLLTAFAEAFEPAKVVALIDSVPQEYSSDPQLLALKERMMVASKTAVGQKYTDFTMKTPEGKEVKLSDFIGNNKYTLVDFWASWCKPCREEMPNVVAAYEAFNQKGFGIVGVSLDNKAEDWKKAIKELNITWPQMSDLKGWNNEAAGIYGVRGIPATLLIDQQGTIVARDLRGEELMTKLSELLQ